MLTVVTGGAMSHKDEFIREKIKKAVFEGKQAYVFVPDQFSFEYDKMLYDIFGAKLFNKIEVCGLNRFCESLRKKYGSEKGQTADENTRTISMYRAVKAFREERKSLYFSKNLEKPFFVSSMLELTGRLAKNSVTPELLCALCEKTSGVLYDKLFDISGIYSGYYRILSEKGVCDGVSVISEACEIIKSNEVLYNCEIFFDRYDTFSADEYKLIEVMLNRCDNMAVAITLSDENNSKSALTPFASTVKTLSELERIAKSNGKAFKRERSQQYYYNTPALTHVNANIFCMKTHPFNISDGVKVAVMQDVYDEVEFVCAQIKSLVRQKNYKYSDIAVISRQLSEYAPIIEGAFERYEIPAFIDAKQNISRSVLAIYITSILECVKGKGFKTERIFRMIKSPLSPFKDFEISALEEYCYTWGVDNDMWQKPFTVCDGKLDNLETLNRVRENIVNPISDFRKNAVNATASQLVCAFSKLLEDFSITSCANSIVKASADIESEKSYITDKSTELELVREFGQIWKLFIDGMYSVDENMGNEKLSLHEFSDLICMLMSQMTISNPPQRINTVTVASAEHSRLSAVRAVFVLGANADKLPAAVSRGGIFSEKERKQLGEIGVLPVSEPTEAIKNERLVAYLAVTQGSDLLYVCCPRTDKKGKGLIPSVIVNDLFKMFGESIKIDVSKLKADFYCVTERAAYAKLSECINDRNSQSETLKEALLRQPDMAYKVQSLIDNRKNKPFSLSEEVSENLFFTKNENEKNIHLSPTQIEKYNYCPFEFFCNTGLRLRTPVKYEMNPINRGNLIHYILEKLLSVDTNEGKKYNGDFEDYTRDEIISYVEKLSQEYKEQCWGGDFGKNSRFNVLFDRLKENAAEVILNIQEELSYSKFKPVAFEYSISERNKTPVLKLEGDGFTVSVSGQIDRVDTYTDENGKTYVKIVDYKTGRSITKDNYLKQVFHGISLQLLIYLLAVLSDTNGLNDGSFEAGGVLYTPTKYINSTSSSSEFSNNFSKLSPDEIKEKINISKRRYVNKQLSRFGIVRNEDEICEALSSADEKKFFVPSDGNSTFSVEVINAIGEHTKAKIMLVGEKLSKGNIEAVSLGEFDNKKIVKKHCGYCDYSDICGMKNAKTERVIYNNDNETFKSRLFGEKDGGEDNGDEMD